MCCKSFDLPHTVRRLMIINKTRSACLGIVPSNYAFEFIRIITITDPNPSSKLFDMQFRATISSEDCVYVGRHNAL